MPFDAGSVMRQILCNAKGAFVARMPAPTVVPGAVLIHVHYSLVSPGTEVAALRESLLPASAATGAERGRAYAGLLGSYVRRAPHDPGRAARRVARALQNDGTPGSGTRVVCDGDWSIVDRHSPDMGFVARQGPIEEI